MPTDPSSREAAEAAREREWRGSGVLHDLCLGPLRLELVHPYPAEPVRPKFRAFRDAVRELLRSVWRNDDGRRQVQRRARGRGGGAARLEAGAFWASASPSMRSVPPVRPLRRCRSEQLPSRMHSRLAGTPCNASAAALGAQNERHREAHCHSPRGRAHGSRRRDRAAHRPDAHAGRDRDARDAGARGDGARSRADGAFCAVRRPQPDPGGQQERRRPSLPRERVQAVWSLVQPSRQRGEPSRSSGALRQAGQDAPGLRQSHPRGRKHRACSPSGPAGSKWLSPWRASPSI